MDKVINALIKLLKMKKRDDLALLLKDSIGEIEQSGQYGSYWNSIISDFVIFSPVEIYTKLKQINKEDKILILDSIKEILPPSDNAPEITSINFRILLNDQSSVQEKVDNEQITSIEKSIRIFMSYSSEDKVIAGKIKLYLQNYFGLEVFLAHEDIEGAEKWEDSILENLKSTDFFVPLLSPDFQKSQFTDQETGVAVALSKRIIPITLVEGSIPYGFIKKIQAAKFRVPSDIHDWWMIFVGKIVDIISKDPLFKNTVRSLVIKTFKNSWSFKFTKNMLPVLRRYEPFDTQEVNEILRAVLDNQQIRLEQFSIPNYVTAILKKYQKIIDKDLLIEIERTY